MAYMLCMLIQCAVLSDASVRLRFACTHFVRYICFIKTPILSLLDIGLERWGDLPISFEKNSRSQNVQDKKKLEEILHSRRID